MPFYSFAESRKMWFEITFDLMETKKKKYQRCSCGLWRCIKRFLFNFLLFFTKSSGSWGPSTARAYGKMYSENNKNHKVNHSFGFIPTSFVRFCFFFFLSRLFFFSCLASTFYTKYYKRARNGCSFHPPLFLPLSVSKYFSSYSICSAIYLPSSFLMPQTKFNLQKSHFFFRG